MRKIAFFCIPAQGHTNPTLGLVRELISQGNEVIYFSYEMLKNKIQEIGAKFFPCDPYDVELNLTDDDRTRIGKDMVFSTKILVDTTLALNDVVCKILTEEKVDCVVADSMAIWGKAAALKLGIPLIMSNTTFAFNRYSAEYMQSSLGEGLSMMMGTFKASKEVKRLQKAGYPFKNVLDVIACDDSVDTIVYTSPEFQPASDTFSDKFLFIGPSIRPTTQEFEKTKEKLVYISMGTVNNAMIDLYKNCIQGLKDINAQIVISIGDQIEPSAFEPLPENISVYPSVDQIAVLSKADAFLSHCGMNSVSEALYFGVPIVTHPVTKEQIAVALRTEELGAGIRLDNETPEGIRATIQSVLSTPSYKENADKISDSFHACPGIKKAAEKILSLCEK